MICKECNKEVEFSEVFAFEEGKPICKDCENKQNIVFKKDKHSFIKADKGKRLWCLLPFKQVEQVVQVLEKGAEKYDVDNWKKCDDVNRYKNALLRHIISYIEDDKIDSETGLSHLAHAVCNCLFLMYFDDKDRK